MKISMIVACGPRGEIGRKGDVPWGRLKKDMQWFVAKTHGKTLVMGRKTYDSLPMPSLPNRKIVVLSRQPDPLRRRIAELSENHRDAVEVVNSIPAAYATAAGLFDAKELVVCGGAAIYDLFLSQSLATMFRPTTIWLTAVTNARGRPFDADTFFPYPGCSDEWQKRECYARAFTAYSGDIKMRFFEYTRL